MHQDTDENNERTRRLLDEFHRRYDCNPMVVRAPGRVNLIGEHTDYNDGFVLPIAIDRDVRFAVCQRRDRLVRLYSLDFDAESEFDLDHVARDDDEEWANYVRGMALELLRYGALLHGMDGVVQGNVPIASGLSSSAAMEVAAGMAFCAVSMAVVEPPCLAQLAQRAENNYMGVRVGIMDQFISRMGHPGHALFLDCRTLEHELIPVPSDEHLFVVTNSRQSRELAGSAYNERRAQCEAAVAVLQKGRPEVKALRDVTLDELERSRSEMDSVVFRRARHVVTENGRVLQAVAALRKGDLSRFGQLMNESHDSLRDDYEVSSFGLDKLVTAARGVDGCLGSRLTGAGFGGCTVSLVRADRVEPFQRHVAEQYREQCGIEAEFYVTRPAAGAGIVQMEESARRSELQRAVVGAKC
jgi:galactokinase